MNTAKNVQNQKPMQISLFRSQLCNFPYFAKFPMLHDDVITRDKYNFFIIEKQGLLPINDFIISLLFYLSLQFDPALY